MADVGHNSGAELKSIVERIENLEEQKKDIAADIREIYAEAKSAGFDSKALRAVIRYRAEDAAKRAEREALLETYLSALGMLGDMPLGQAALERDGLTELIGEPNERT